MFASTLLLGAIATLLDTASAHGFVTGIRAGGTFTAGSEPNWFYMPANQRKQTAGWDALNQDNGFVEPAALGSSDINCHKSATAGRLYVNVAAGSTVEIPWVSISR
jgi:cellulase